MVQNIIIFFTGNENNYTIFRHLIYEAAKKNIKTFIPLFITSEEEQDDIIVNRKFENYIEEIEKDGLFACNLEIAISSILFNLNISIYKIINELDISYNHYTNVWKDINDSELEIMTVLFSGNNHYSLLTFNNNINSNIDTNEIKNKNYKY